MRYTAVTIYRKKINGRKSTILVGTTGISWSIKVTTANVSDYQTGMQSVEKLRGNVPRLQKITVDHGYKTTFLEHVIKKLKLHFSILPDKCYGCRKVSAQASAYFPFKYEFLFLRL